jgi:hypothetical protein
MSSHCRRVAPFFCYLFATGWFLMGLVYAYAGTVAPAVFRVQTLASTEDLRAFFATLHAAWLLYVLAFVLFAVADFSLIIVSAGLRELLGRDDFRAQAIYLTIAFAIFCGFLVDIILLSCWWVIGQYALQAPADVLPAMWTTFLFFQAVGIWMSAIPFMAGALAFVGIHRLAVEKGLPPFWARWTLLLAAVMIVLVAFIIYDTSLGGSGLGTGLTFLLITNVIGPVWAIGLARILRAAAG